MNPTDKKQSSKSVNEAEAANRYRQAAEQGDAEAQYQLHWCYLNGKGVPQNDVEAIIWLRKAAEQGCTSDGGSQRLLPYW